MPKEALRISIIGLEFNNRWSQCSETQETIARKLKDKPNGLDVLSVDSINRDTSPPVRSYQDALIHIEDFNSLINSFMRRNNFFNPEIIVELYPEAPLLEQLPTLEDAGRASEFFDRTFD